MRVFVLFCSVLMMVAGRPEPPLGGGGYSYVPPSSGSISSSNSYVPPSSGSYAPPRAEYGAPAQLPTVHKHVYVHVPPPEPEEYRPQRPIHVGTAQKHYKIIFIKAPSAPTPTAPIIPLQPQNEEKTLVYVLVKKPEDAPEIHIPTPAPTQPSKPEVYFIRYKTQKQEGYAESGVPQNQYGAPAAPPSAEYGAPSGGY